VLLAKLPRLDWELARRAELGDRYAQSLAGLDMDRLAVRPGRDCVWAQYTVMVNERPRVQQALHDAGVPTAVHYPRPLHRQPAYEAFAPNCSCPVAERLADRVLSLPMSADLTLSDQDRVVTALAAAVGRRSVAA
jgi:UDP-2-acetamido-2-deoxy-ribo-hexuluronate aminotransferase